MLKVIKLDKVYMGVAGGVLLLAAAIFFMVSGRSTHLVANESMRVDGAQERSLMPISSTEKLQQLRQQIAMERSEHSLEYLEGPNAPLVLITYKQQGQWAALLSYNGGTIEVFKGSKLPDGALVSEVTATEVALQPNEGEQYAIHFADKYEHPEAKHRKQQIIGILEVTAPKAAEGLR